jgi:hypothetical protein
VRVHVKTAFCASALLGCMGSRAEDACDAFSWNVKQERGLFAMQPHALAAGREPGSAPRLRAAELYALMLAPDSQVRFVVAPARKTPKPESHAGIVRVEIRDAGLYRVSVDQPAWVDVVAGGKAIASKDFQGKRGCSAPHKVVEFVLPASRNLVLQLSNASESARVTLTRAP